MTGLETPDIKDGSDNLRDLVGHQVGDIVSSQRSRERFVPAEGALDELERGGELGGSRDSRRVELHLHVARHGRKRDGQEQRPHQHRVTLVDSQQTLQKPRAPDDEEHQPPDPRRRRDRMPIDPRYCTWDQLSVASSQLSAPY